ncbi:aminoglycoside phosphotransferase family protein [Pseudoalteromonas obscura]|uniref:Phosphotransferase n=1 Tax=Pseudoalteromonas obscura TaxID=3048491 RepID=A0ABT7EMR0_9GAMM|nr:phosphotransferase [Pseudoalteromonas sp. P94(2023)]MDK2596340.1 phosphotransferase [Pseudoalteromonas sp. P94(2023)]
MASLTPTLALQRKEQRIRFVETHIKQLNQADDELTISAITGDASFRLYFRVRATQSQYVLMDVPPDKGSIEAFIHLNHVFSQGGLAVPEIFAFDTELGFVLLEDLGSVHLADIIAQQGDYRYYSELLAWLPQIATLEVSKWMNTYDAPFIEQEINIFKSWLLESWLGYRCSPEVTRNWQLLVSRLSESMITQPQVVMHRDFHSRNIMYSQAGGRLIDYQDAVVGPVCYDAVSLLKDCYLKLPSQQFEQLKRESYQHLADAGLLPDMSFAQYVESFNLTGLQRHLKAAGIFARLHLRDGKPGYLPSILPTLNYIVETAEMFTEFQWLATWLQSEIIPMIEKKLTES